MWLMNKLAIQLNKDLGAASDFLSRVGKRIYFPYGGILGQGNEAKICNINATIGMAFEEDGTALVMDCFSKNINLDKKAFLYSGSFGNPELRSVWKQKQIEKNPSLENVTYSMPVVTNALTHSLRVAAELFCDSKDEVVVPDLYWDNYDLLFLEAVGCKKRMFNTFKNGCFDADAMKKALLSPGDKKILVLNFPNNPTGYTATVEDAKRIVSAVEAAANKGKKIVVLLDDAYFGLVYEKGVHDESLFAEFCQLHENVLAVKLDGLTKEDYVWGLRVGFIAFGFKGASEKQLKAFEAKAAGNVRSCISNVTSIGQTLALKAFEDKAYNKQKKEKYNCLKSRYMRIRKILEQNDYSKFFEPMPFNSGYFMCIKPHGVDVEKLRKYLIEKYSIGTVVISGLVRLAFSTVPKSKLARLFGDIAKAIGDLQQK
jgi:aspartate/methionine/tyrosine aminotransferase